MLKNKVKLILNIDPDYTAALQQKVIIGKVDVGSVILADGWRRCNELVYFGYKKHFRVHHDKNEFARENSHINEIESFGGYAKTRLVKFKGINKNMFELHLKECEFRFNQRGENMYQILLKLFKDEPLKLS